MADELTDKQWFKAIANARKFYEMYKRHLDNAEQEYKRRYGRLPSEVDDDWWIEALHQGQGEISIEIIKEHAEAKNYLS